MAIQPYTEDSEVTNPVKRIRWATKRVVGHKGDQKRSSLRARFHKTSASRNSNGTLDSTVKAEDGSGSETGSDSGDKPQRRIFFNQPLPADARDEDGHPLDHYARNKIRTSKYTPLDFVPKNLWFQFHNIANIYFLFIIILGIFSIFGASNPGLNAVPLIVIVTVTAIKDAVEDWGRTVLDNTLNNRQVSRLVDYENVNTAEDTVSVWRRFKKASTRSVIWTWRKLKSRKNKGQGAVEAYAERAIGEYRPSVESELTRTSFHSTRTRQGQGVSGYELEAVPSPLPGQGPSESEQLPLPDKRATTTLGELQTTKNGEKGVTHEKRFYGSVINPHKTAPGKARFKADAWKNVQVGDYVRVYNGDEMPADIVVLSTADTDGACYIETKNLDGETNLKVRSALRCGRKVNSARLCEKAEFVIESETPTANLYAYSALIKWDQKDPRDPSAPGTEMVEPISINNLLLRGTILRNTEWVLGVVVFTGQETKIMLNSGITPSKRAKISKDLNWNVIYNFIVLFCMCLIAGIVQGVTWSQGNNSLDFFEFGSIGGNPALDGFITFWAAIILFQNLVPISLYITLEIIRTLQAVFIWSDIGMYYEKLDYPCTPKSWNISDDLGQIEYIFSDKTGTLTQNVMEFKKATVNGYAYGEAYTEAQAGMDRRNGIDVETTIVAARDQIARDRVRMIEGIRKLHDNPFFRDEDLTFVAPDFIEDLAGGGPARNAAEQKTANYEFMLALALCHTVITEKTPGDPPKLEFKAQSPDEAALVATARDCGFTVTGRAEDDVILNIMGREERYTILNTLEFNSTRKRMSAIVRMPNGKIMLYCKGADTMIYSRLTPNLQREMRDQTAKDLEMFAREGLRTLCIAQKEVDEEYWRDWNKRHDLAAAAVQNREDKLEEIADEIEQELMLLGGTAIEDKLQDGVPQAIERLGLAGIKLWVLTGDKVETAINIGFSCNLLTNDMDLLRIETAEGDLEGATRIINNYMTQLGITGSDEELAAAQNDHQPPAPTHAVVIDGDSLRLVLHEDLRQKFLLLCKQCKAVLCCRVSPAQKAAVVSLVKNGLNCLTLSIGDGANDVAMIQEAHVGVGIAGEEGRQAVMSSDYAIGQFRFLTRLLLVHGRWSYRRLAETIANFFYKNLVWVFALFWYQIYDDFDCTYVFDYTYIILYNLAFTSLAFILLGVLDQDVSDKVSMAVPELYRRGIERKEWTQRKFWLYMLDGLYQSIVVFFVAYLIFAPANFVTDNGLGVDDPKRMGVYIATAAVFIVNIYVLLNTYRWDWLILLIVAISILLIWFWTGVYTATTGGFQFYQAAPQVYGQVTFWCNLGLAIIIALLPRFMIKAYQKIRMPRDIDIIREQCVEGDFDYLNENDDFFPKTPREQLMSKKKDSTGKTRPENGHDVAQRPEDEQPMMYPPSVTNTAATTHNQRSHNGSDGTDYTGHRSSFDFRVDPPATVREDVSRPRPSFDRARQSMDRVRPSFEASRDFTSAAMLQRLESSQSARSGNTGHSGMKHER
ncbi:phospholipid-translocating P-type ATPase [Aulographum hederae CBS 113979]|uniref:Phospholipid-transporting ATPase n=1 Tax=Aulographum hederae CBS 113979 TaxID=1176131 RepID=A0A6G1HF31_9PEZI|nr:phospholipid-translocating P-type ATPase [Aulographum hederae CBS 113979]